MVRAGRVRAAAWTPSVVEGAVGVPVLLDAGRGRLAARPPGAHHLGPIAEGGGADRTLPEVDGEDALSGPGGDAQDRAVAWRVAAQDRVQALQPAVEQVVRVAMQGVQGEERHRAPFRVR